MTDQIQHWRTIQQMLRGYRAAHVLITCAQLGIFRHLAGGGQEAATLAAKTETDPQALRRLLDAAVALELLSKIGRLYANAPLAQTCLAAEGPYYLGNIVRREGAFYQRWSYLTEAVRTGQRPQANIRDEGQENWVYDFEMALFDIARVTAPAMAEALDIPGDRPVRVLDVGGGHGGYSMALARRYPNVAATVYELPPATEVARQIIEREGMAGRVAVQEGDFQQEALGHDYDLILLFGVLVSETPEGKLDLLRKSHAALVPGGAVAIRGFWLNEDRAGPLESTMFSLHMLLSTEAGDISTLREMKELLHQAGFNQMQEAALPEWLGSSLLVAQKPKQ